MMKTATLLQNLTTFQFKMKASKMMHMITGFDAELKLTEDWLEKPNYVEVDCTITAGARSLA